MEAIHTEEYRGHTIEIVPDCDADSPREDDGNLSVMACWARRYSLGDDKTKWDEQWETPQEFLNWAKEHPEMVVAKLYLYDHTIQSISMESFVGRAHHADWDSGIIGFIYMDPMKIITDTSPIGALSYIDKKFVTYGPRGKHKINGAVARATLKRLEKAFKSKTVTKDIRLAALGNMRAETEHYDTFVRGQVYGYSVDGPLSDDSCWGYFGDYDETGGALDEAKSAIDAAILREKREAEKTGRSMAI